MTIDRLGVIGSGAWGTALAHLAVKAGSQAVLWGRDAETVDVINRDHVNPAYLKNLPLDPRLRATTDLARACRNDAILLVVPAQAVRAIAAAMAGELSPGTPVICCAKGLEIGTGLLMSEVLAEILPGHPIGCLSGPTFAAEVVLGLPTAATLAIGDAELGRALAMALGAPAFRPYVASDVIGAEVGGAVKNVLAIACGVAAGQGFGENTRAALITRGLAEMTRLAVALGGQSETLAGLAGLGDLAMTCASRQSRNFRFGEALGAGTPAEQSLAGMGGVVEGWHSASAVMRRANALGVELPICQAIDAVLNHGADLDAAIQGLMRRPLRTESDAGPD